MHPASQATMLAATEVSEPGFYWYYVSADSTPSLVEIMAQPVMSARFAGDTRRVPVSALNGLLAGPLSLSQARDPSN